MSGVASECIAVSGVSGEESMMQLLGMELYDARPRYLLDGGEWPDVHPECAGVAWTCTRWLLPAASRLWLYFNS